MSDKEYRIAYPLSLINKWRELNPYRYPFKRDYARKINLKLQE